MYLTSLRGLVGRSEVGQSLNVLIQDVALRRVQVNCPCLPSALQINPEQIHPEESFCAPHRRLVRLSLPNQHFSDWNLTADHLFPNGLLILLKQFVELF